jgi:hypothetical protein
MECPMAKDDGPRELCTSLFSIVVLGTQALKIMETIPWSLLYSLSSLERLPEP